LTKLLLIPIAVVAFLVFLIVLGAIGLAIAFILLATLGKIWQVISITARVISRRGRRQRT
jgi:hypothetical protein